jgi:hypothetical protein
MAFFKGLGAREKRGVLHPTENRHILIQQPQKSNSVRTYPVEGKNQGFGHWLLEIASCPMGGFKH